MFRPALIFGLWFLMAVFAVSNGILGKFVLQPMFGEYANHLIKTFLGIIVIFVVSWFYARATRSDRPFRAAWLAGVTWLLATIAFEFVAGHYLFGNSWERLFADYRIWEGRVWLLFLTALLVAPPLMACCIQNRIVSDD